MKLGIKGIEEIYLWSEDVRDLDIVTTGRLQSGYMPRLFDFPILSRNDATPSRLLAIGSNQFNSIPTLQSAFGYPAWLAFLVTPRESSIRSAATESLLAEAISFWILPALTR